MTLKDSLLWPFTLTYGAVSRLRARTYRAGILRQRRLEGVVISVGNLTTGGTGKTPMVLWIAQRLLAEGKRAAILTRGYRGETSPAGRTSDEAQLLRSRLGEAVALGVGADRFARGEELATRGLSAAAFSQATAAFTTANNTLFGIVSTGTGGGSGGGGGGGS